MRYASLLIHHFALCVPRKILDATKFQQRYHRYEEIENVPDRLRWCQYSRGLTQAEVAQKLGISTNVYKNIEDGITQCIPQEVTEKLAQLYGLPVQDFMDAYNRFLYRGQADCIRKYRAETGLGQKAFARKNGHPVPQPAGVGKRQKDRQPPKLGEVFLQWDIKCRKYHFEDRVV